MNVRYKVVAISGRKIGKLESLPNEVLQMILRELPIKYLVQAGLINHNFKELVGSIVQDGFELAELIRFMKFRMEAKIPVPIELNKPICENRGPLAVLYRNYQMVNACMKYKPMSDWIYSGRGIVEWGMRASSSYVPLNMSSPAVYGLLNDGQGVYYGVIKIRTEQLNMVYYPGKIDKLVVPFDGKVFEWVGCEIEANGELVGGKIEKKVYRGPNGYDFEFLGCEIDVGGELVGGKIEKKVYRGPDGRVWEYYG